MPDQLFNLTQCGALLSVDVSTASRKAAAGKFGAPVIRGGRKFFRLSEIQRGTGKTFTPEQIEAASNARSFDGPPLAKILLQLMSLVRQLRDQAWVTALHEQGITNFTPPPINKGISHD